MRLLSTGKTDKTYVHVAISILQESCRSRKKLYCWRQKTCCGRSRGLEIPMSVTERCYIDMRLMNIDESNLGSRLPQRGIGRHSFNASREVYADV